MRNTYLFIAGLSIIVLVLLVATFIEIGTPISARSIALDAQRITAFGDISYEIQDYFDSKGKLPNSLSGVTSTYLTEENLKDPETKKPYEYNKISDTQYSLCTTFSTDSEEVAKRKNIRAFEDSYYPSKKHKKGYFCIEYKVDDYGYLEDSLSTSEENNTKRRSDVAQILNAISAYAADNNGILPTGIATKSGEIASNGADVCSTIVPDYMPNLPVDPSVDDGLPFEECEEEYYTGYTVIKDTNDRVTVKAPFAEEGERIEITR